MKAILGTILLAFLLAFPTYAAKPEKTTEPTKTEEKAAAKPEGEHFAKKKAEELERLDKKIARLQAERSCVLASTTSKELNKCEEQAEEKKGDKKK